jgi:DNA-binding PadR family transcriptional regulator
LTKKPFCIIISLVDIPIYDITGYDIMKMTAIKFETGKYLPLTEATYYIMLALIEPRHGYAVMQKVEEISGGQVRVGPGTLYGVFTTLEKEKLIVKVREEERRKSYTLTDRGRAVLMDQITRLELMSQSGLAALKQLKKAGYVAGGGG